MATAAGSEGDSVDLGAGLAEDSVGVASLVGVAEVGLLVGSFRGLLQQIASGEAFFLLLAYAWCTFLIGPDKNHAYNKAEDYIVTNVDD